MEERKSSKHFHPNSNSAPNLNSEHVHKMKRENDDFAGRSSNSVVVELYQSQMDEIAQEKTSLPSDSVYFSIGSDSTTANIIITFTIKLIPFLPV